MILSISYRGVFRQEQYETVTIEGALTLDSDKDPEWFTAGDDIVPAMRTELLRLIGPLMRDASQISRYDADETVLYEWERITSNDTTGDAPQDRQHGRRVQRRR